MGTEREGEQERIETSVSSSTLPEEIKRKFVVGVTFSLSFFFLLNHNLREVIEGGGGMKGRAVKGKINRKI